MPQRSHALRALKILGALLGLGLFGALVAAAGPAEIAAQLRPLGVAGVALFLGGMAVGYTFDAIAWWCSFPGRSPVSVWRLYWVRVAGESINNTVPSYLGGEPVKALLLFKQGLGGAESAASVVVSKTALLVAMGLFVATGGFAACFQGRDSEHFSALIAVSFVFAVGLVLFLFLVVQMQRHGLGRLLRRFSARTGLISGLVERNAAGLDRFDELMARFYGGHPRRFWLVTWWSFLGFVAETLELLVFAWWLEIPLDFPTAYAIAALVNLARVAGFMIPASLGALEGGTVLVFVVCGLTQVQALAFCVVRRFRELLWIGVGLALLGWWGLLGRRGQLLGDPEQVASVLSPAKPAE